MVVDFVCHNCTSWSGGTLDLTSPVAPFIWAVGPGASVHSDDVNTQAIQQHSSYGKLFTRDPNVCDMVNPADAHAYRRFLRRHACCTYYNLPTLHVFHGPSHCRCPHPGAAFVLQFARNRARPLPRRVLPGTIPARCAPSPMGLGPVVSAPLDCAITHYAPLHHRSRRCYCP